MIFLRQITQDDIAVIKGWPPYPAEFGDLDYALRDGGWLDEYSQKPDADILIADDEGTIAGLSIIAREPGGIAEFRIALHPERCGRGFGRTVAYLSLVHGFSDTTTGTVRLIVRKNNPRAKRLYEEMHFRNTGECIEEIQGKPVEFYRMEINRIAFYGADA
ncbi:GNAT family N-acetyltransferase [Methanoculleus sp. Afa-1]|uniref:GNAT family N-acetyltransferase n=1 Tax=Methanoculleus formosensis TaxID=2590886 RepID=A0A9E5DF69_9EURY|nr:GNAT family protein [Methanoculleus sp. Afa-1]MCT8338384.1 GNAT family N-acetyltransferase [Methanoculleus sp. Afa-1]